MTGNFVLSPDAAAIIMLDADIESAHSLSFIFFPATIGLLGCCGCIACSFETEAASVDVMPRCYRRLLKRPVHAAMDAFVHPISSDLGEKMRRLMRSHLGIGFCCCCCCSCRKWAWWASGIAATTSPPSSLPDDGGAHRARTSTSTAQRLRLPRRAILRFVTFVALCSQALGARVRCVLRGGGLIDANQSLGEWGCFIFAGRAQRLCRGVPAWEGANGAICTAPIMGSFSPAHALPEPESAALKLRDPGGGSVNP